MPTKSLVNIKDLPNEVRDMVRRDQSDRKPETTNTISEKQQNATQTSSTTRESRVRLKWEDRLAQLRDFKSKHGHVDVPRSYVKDPSLATFVCNQRQSYKRMIEAKGPSLNNQRMQQLEALGFKWVLRHKDQREVVEDRVAESNAVSDPNSAAVSKRNETNSSSLTEQTPHETADLKSNEALTRRSRKLDWEDGLENLKEFEINNGHLNVPHIYAANQPLGNFVKSVRQHYKQIMKGKSSNLLTEERITELETLGFKLIVRQREPWNERFAELKEHVNKHGHCEVPKHTPLGIWILNQRSQYKLMMKNKPSHMTEDRIMALNSIGFDWRIPIRNMQVNDQFYVFAGRAYVAPAKVTLHKNSEIQSNLHGAPDLITVIAKPPHVVTRISSEDALPRNAMERDHSFVTYSSFEQDISEDENICIVSEMHL